MTQSAQTSSASLKVKSSLATRAGRIFSSECFHTFVVFSPSWFGVFFERALPLQRQLRLRWLCVSGTGMDDIIAALDRHRKHMVATVECPSPFNFTICVKQHWHFMYTTVYLPVLYLSVSIILCAFPHREIQLLYWCFDFCDQGQYFECLGGSFPACGFMLQCYGWIFMICFVTIIVFGNHQILLLLNGCRQNIMSGSHALPPFSFLERISPEPSVDVAH